MIMNSNTAWCGQPWISLLPTVRSRYRMGSKGCLLASHRGTLFLDTPSSGDRDHTHPQLHVHRCDSESIMAVSSRPPLQNPWTSGRQIEAGSLSVVRFLARSEGFDSGRMVFSFQVLKIKKGQQHVCCMYVGIQIQQPLMVHNPAGCYPETSPPKTSIFLRVLRIRLNL